MAKEYVDQKGLHYIISQGKSVIKSRDKEFVIQDIFYFSQPTFQSLYYEDYKSLLDKDNCCGPEIREEFIQECIREPQFEGIGGVLIFFVKKGEG